MNTHFLLPTLQTACSACVLAHSLGTLGPRADFVIAFDLSGQPHVLFAEDYANFHYPRHIQSAELLNFNVSGVAAAVAALGLPHAQASERMTSVVLANLAALLGQLRTLDPRPGQLGAELASYALAGILARLAAGGPAPAAAGPGTRAASARN